MEIEWRIYKHWRPWVALPYVLMVLLIVGIPSLTAWLIAEALIAAGKLLIIVINLPNSSKIDFLYLDKIYKWTRKGIK